MEEHEKASPPSCKEIMEQVVRVLYQASRKVTPETAQTMLVGASIGAVSAAKLMVRIETGGGIILPSVYGDIQVIEDYSIKLASEFFHRVAEDIAGCSGSLHTGMRILRNALLVCPSFARSDGAMVFRWATPLSMADFPPVELYDVEDVAPFVDEVLVGMMTIFLGAVEAAGSSDQASLHARISVIIAFSAAARVLMTFWGEGALASGLETVADLDSEKRYSDVCAALASSGPPVRSLDDR